MQIVDPLVDRGHHLRTALVKGFDHHANLSQFRGTRGKRGQRHRLLRRVLDGRYNVSFEDIRKVFLPAMRHRVLLNFEAQAENVSTDTVLAAILNEVKDKEEGRR